MLWFFSSVQGVAVEVAVGFVDGDLGGLSPLFGAQHELDEASAFSLDVGTQVGVVLLAV